METNQTPIYDMSDNPTGCCPRFAPEGWDGQELKFENKRFAKAKTKSLFFFPLNMGGVFKKTFAAIERAQALDEKQSIVLSHDASPWSAEHYFAVTRDVSDAEMTTLSGDYRTKVFEGPYKNMGEWKRDMAETVTQDGNKIKNMYFFYPTCPKCSKAYGKNYVVGVAEI